MIRLLYSAVFITSSFLLAADGVSNASDHSGAVIAEIDQVKITRGDFERKNPARLFQARNTFHEAERKAVDEFVDEYLLERQAKKENLTVAELLDRHVNSKIAPDPSDEALRVYYEGVDTTEPFEVVKGKIIDSLRQRRAGKIKAAYMQSLRVQSRVAVRLSTPRVQVSMKDTPVRGPQNAPVMLVEYADYECPYCQQIQPALDKLRAEYKDKLAFAYKDVPLPMHANAQKAAEAAHCAGNQGKYWEYHDILTSKKPLDIGGLRSYARDLKLDTGAFDKCLDAGDRAQVVKSSLDEAQSLGLQGTPSFFINGRFFAGAATYEKLRDLVEEELAVSAEQSKTARR